MVFGLHKIEEFNDTSFLDQIISDVNQHFSALTANAVLLGVGMRWIWCLPVLLLSSCGTCWRGGEPLRVVEKQSLRRVAQDLHAAGKLELYRGLAHPQKDAARYAKQLRTVPHVMWRDFAFYRDPLPESQTLGRRLVALYTQPESHQALAAPKTSCAGFHPDYALVWRDARGERVLQVCYGCHEWKYFGPGGVLHTDINEPAYFDELMRWLPSRP